MIEGTCHRQYIIFMIQNKKSNLRRGFNHVNMLMLLSIKFHNNFTVLMSHDISEGCETCKEIQLKVFKL